MPTRPSSARCRARRAPARPAAARTLAVVRQRGLRRGRASSATTAATSATRASGRFGWRCGSRGRAAPVCAPSPGERASDGRERRERRQRPRAARAASGSREHASIPLAGAAAAGAAAPAAAEAAAEPWPGARAVRRGQPEQQLEVELRSVIRRVRADRVREVGDRRASTWSCSPPAALERRSRMPSSVRACEDARSRRRSRRASARPARGARRLDLRRVVEPKVRRGGDRRRAAARGGWSRRRRAEQRAARPPSRVRGVHDARSGVARVVASPPRAPFAMADVGGEQQRRRRRARAAPPREQTSRHGVAHSSRGDHASQRGERDAGREAQATRPTGTPCARRGAGSPAAGR